MINASSIIAFLPYLKNIWNLAWLGSGLLAIFVPVMIWGGHRATYFRYVGQALKYEDDQEKAQWYYEQNQQQQNNNYYGNNNNGNGNNNGSYFKKCSWINFACRSKQYNYYMASEANDGDRVRQYFPTWYILFGKETEEMQRWKEENNGQEGGRNERRNASTVNGGLVFAYILTLALFLALLTYGAITIGKKQPLTTLTALLVVALIVGLMNMFVSMGAISSDDADLEDSYYGWYGQTSVLMVYTNFWMMLFSFGFLVAFQVKNFLERRSEGIENAEGDEDESSTSEPVTDYKAPSEVQMA